jgi:hypothetical protein
MNKADGCPLSHEQLKAWQSKSPEGHLRSIGTRQLFSLAAPVIAPT